MNNKTTRPPINELKGEIIGILCSKEFENAFIQDKATILEEFILSRSKESVMSGDKLSHDELLNKIADLDFIRAAEQRKLIKKYVDDNARFKIGDMVGNICGILKVEEIRYDRGRNYHITIIYHGRRYKKIKGKFIPTKHGKQHVIADYNNTSLKKLQ